MSSNRDHVDVALNQIERAFKFNKPAIINSHRVNYVGSIHPENRTNGLKLLSNLLIRMINKWPDLIFMSSDELGKIIEKS